MMHSNPLATKAAGAHYSALRLSGEGNYKAAQEILLDAEKSKSAPQSRERDR